MNRASLSAYGRVLIDKKSVYYRVNIIDNMRIYTYITAIPTKVSPNLDKALVAILMNKENLSNFINGQEIILKIKKQ